jgi:aminobenzoyl-glutamate utilization protein B
MAAQIDKLLRVLQIHQSVVISGLRRGGSLMIVRNRMRRRRVIVAIASLMLALVLVFNRATADSPADAKRVALEVVDRNAAQIATVGDVLYYFGEPGMQEYESSKYLKTTLEQIGFKVEVGGAGLPTNVWAIWGSGKPVIAIATEMDSLPEGS